MITLMILNAAVTGFMGFVWSKRTWFNLILKLMLLSLFAADVFFLFQQFGFIIKV
jgi:hypothetical protein